jgi:hypothetical protein
MKKLLRLDDLSRGGRSRGEVFDLLGLRVIVSPQKDSPLEQGEATAIQVYDLVSLNIMFQRYAKLPQCF